MAPRARRRGSASSSRGLLPFLEVFPHKAPRRWAPVYLRGLLGPGDRESIQPTAARVVPEDHE